MLFCVLYAIIYSLIGNYFAFVCVIRMCPVAICINAQACVSVPENMHKAQVFMSEPISLQQQFGNHMPLAPRRGETCGEWQLWRVKTFFMDDFLWHGQETQKREMGEL